MGDVRGVRPWPATAAVVIYVVVSLLARGLTGGEIYPFFTWDLFSRIPAEQLRATIHLEAVAAERLDQPVGLFGSRYSRGSDIVGNQLAASLVGALREDPAEVRRLATALQRHHLPPGATWSLVWERYDPLERVAGVAPETFEAARFGPAPDLLPRDHRLDRDAGRVEAPEGNFELVDGLRGVLTAEELRDDGRLRISGWAGDPQTGDLPVRLVLFDGADPIAFAGVGASGVLAVETTGQEALDRAGFTRVVAAEHAPTRLDDLAVVALFEDGTASELPSVAP